MPERLVLLGSAEGPWCGISEVRNPVLRIRGEHGGVTAEVRLRDPGESFLMADLKSGDYPLGGSRFSWIKVQAKSPSKSLVCIVIPAEAA